MSTAKVYLDSFAILKDTSRNTNDHQSDPAILGDEDCLVIRFDALPASMQFKRLVVPATFSVYISKLTDSYDDKYPSAKLSYAVLFSLIDTNTITYNNDQGVLNRVASSLGNAVAETGWHTFEFVTTDDALNYGVAVKQWWHDSYASIRTTGTMRPYISVETDDSETVGVAIRKCTPSSGSISKKSDNTFSWHSVAAAPSSPVAEQASAVFRWRAGASGTVHEVSVAGKLMGVTIPANTFTADEIQWQVAVTANSGVVTTSEWMTLSTLDVKPEAKVISPHNTVVDATADNVFIWEHIISSGTAQSKADLQKSVDGSTWTTLATVTGAATQWTCPAGTLASSIKYWRVRTYNADSVASDWSDAAQIVVIAAPPTPVIQIQTSGPRPSISWQTSGQQAAQVSIEGVYDSGTVYGVTQQWTSPMYLDDGDYVVRVRVQNEYGLWSEWGSAALQVINTPGAAIALSVRTSHVADLEWTTTGAYDYYLIYRNGVPIAKTTQRAYSDALSVGPTVYRVRGCYAANGNYGISDQVSTEVIPSTTMVSDLDTGEWIRLPYAATPNRKTSRTRARTVNYLTLSGVKYPCAEISDNYTDALTIEAAFAAAEDARALEALLGRLVCAKTPTEDMVIGYLDALQKDHDGFATTLTFTIQQIDYNEEVQL